MAPNDFKKSSYPDRALHNQSNGGVTYKSWLFGAAPDRRSKEEHAESAVHSLGLVLRNIGWAARDPFLTAAPIRQLLREQPWQRRLDLRVLSVPYSDEREILGDILKFGADVVVVAPADLKRKVHQAALALAGRYV